MARAGVGSKSDTTVAGGANCECFAMAKAIILPCAAIAAWGIARNARSAARLTVPEPIRSAIADGIYEDLTQIVIAGERYDTLPPRRDWPKS